ncbi:class F sortase [Bacillus solitudinis]|uniref:class F sortase n=1 Tax=Bacillus solitudinis TaxID=2014074 RepID=UPI0012FDBE8A|nr:class F sortase [Bacillus solitudinis]
MFANPAYAKPSLTGTEPILLKIPSLQIEAPIKPLGVNEMYQVPADGQSVFWYKDGINPGGKGSAVIAGHFDDYEGPAVFYPLRSIQAGEMVYILDRDNHLLMFEVEEITSFPRENTSVEDIFKTSGQPYLILVTCEGFYNRTQQTHTHRLVVKAKRVGTYHTYRPKTERVE